MPSHTLSRLALPALLLAACGQTPPGPQPSAPHLRPLATNAVTVDWFSPTGRVTTGETAGLNLFSGVNDSIAREPKYVENMRAMNAGLVRYHYAGMLNDAATDASGWTSAALADTASRGWDTAKIARVLDAEAQWSPYAPAVMVNIPNWPAWMNTYSQTVGPVQAGGLLADSAAERQRYADFCAALVRILNVDQRRGVKYFEVMNEPDDRYYNAVLNDGANAGWDASAKVDELASVYNAAASAMKAVDPSIRVGGPSFARPDRTAQIRRFIAGTKNNLDFLSYHFYASGDKWGDSDDKVYTRATADLAGHSRDIRAALDAESPARRIPLFLDEYNISWSYQNDDLRMTTNKGAVFDALAIVSALGSGTDATLAWNERDGVYGKMDNGNGWRVGANTFHLFNNELVGEQVAASSFDAGQVVAFATRNLARSQKSLLLINRSGADLTVTPDFAGWTPQNPTLRQRTIAWDPNYYTERDVSFASVQSGVALPANSVTVLTATDTQTARGGNLLANPSFEAGSLSGWALWSDTGTANAAYAEWGGAQDGGWHGTHWSPNPYRVYTSQTLTGLANGAYTARAWVKSSGGQAWAGFEVKDYGGAKVEGDLRGLGSGAYTQVSLTGIQVTNNQATVGFWSDAGGGNWLHFDHVEFFRQP